jgi:hypothetical protein
MIAFFMSDFSILSKSTDSPSTGMKLKNQLLSTRDWQKENMGFYLAVKSPVYRYGSLANNCSNTQKNDA